PTEPLTTLTDRRADDSLPCHRDRSVALIDTPGHSEDGADEDHTDRRDGVLNVDTPIPGAHSREQEQHLAVVCRGARRRRYGAIVCIVPGRVVVTILHGDPRPDGADVVRSDALIIDRTNGAKVYPPPSGDRV